MAEFLNLSQDPEGRFRSPLNQGLINRAYENLEVRLLHTPDQFDFIKTAQFGEFAHAGGTINPIEELDNLSVADLVAKTDQYMHGGLEQFQESDTITFLAYGCTRGFTHEMVRTRNAWYLQQTMRHTYMGNANLRMPERIVAAPLEVRTAWISSNRRAVQTYMELCEKHDIPFQDARSVLPLGTETWIMAGMSVREFIRTYSYRACWMFYPEMRWIMQEAGKLVRESCPWLADKIVIECEKDHKCYYKGVDKVDDLCPLEWGKEENRIWRSRNFS